MKARISFLYAQKNFEEIQRRIHQSMNYILLLAIGCFGGVIGISSTFIPVFLGKGYDEVVRILYLMSPLIIIIGISNCMGAQYYTPTGKRAKSAKVIVLAAVINIILNLLLIPKFQSYGATVGSIIAELTITLIYVHLCDGYMSWSLIWKYGWKRIIAAGIMAPVVFAVGKFLPVHGVLLIAVQVFSGVMTYGLILLLLKDDMVLYLLNILKKGFVKVKQRIG